tara:strand:- start:185 stop:424 length:240 start_codon:yes stop_codon:yes gene_type:complete
MNSNPENTLNNQPIEQENTDSENINLKPSATTKDIPEFGWSGYAERINGRFGMVGFIAVLLIEALSRVSFLEWSGIIPK